VGLPAGMLGLAAEDQNRHDGQDAGHLDGK